MGVPATLTPAVDIRIYYANWTVGAVILSQAPVVQMSDTAIHRINHHPADSVIVFCNTYPLDSDLSGG